MAFGNSLSVVDKWYSGPSGQALKEAGKDAAEKPPFVD